jgi:hypothetical protein
MPQNGKLFEALAVLIFTGSTVLFSWMLLFNGQGSEDSGLFFLLMIGIPAAVGVLFYRRPGLFTKVLHRLFNITPSL